MPAEIRPYPGPASVNQRPTVLVNDFPGSRKGMGLLLLAAAIIAIAFGVGALVHFLWLGLIVLAIVFLAGLIVRG